MSDEQKDKTSASKTSDPTASAKPARQDGQWTESEWVADGKDKKSDPGSYNADQWVGEGQGDTSDKPDGSWTKGEWVGEGQGEGPQQNTGTYNAEQWVGEGQDKPKNPPTHPSKKT